MTVNTEKKRKKNPNLQLIALDETKQSEFKTKIKKLKKKKPSNEDFDSDKPGVVFLKHIPHGFFEPQMKRYFSQFGDVNKLRLSRSKKSGRSKGYAYIEFSCEEVAKVVAETMNNYLMFNRCLKCEVVPLDKLHPDTFKGHDRVFYLPTSRKNSIRKFNNRSSDPEKVAKREKRLRGTNSKLESKLKELGIEYDIRNLKTNPDWKPPPRKLPPPPTVTSLENEGKNALNQTADSTLDVTKEMLIDKEDNEIVFKTPPKSSNVTVKVMERDTLTSTAEKRPRRTPKVTKSSRKSKMAQKRMLLNMTM
uniref:RRM domain-containing protein n=1 Tax=Ciona savignyi TaxID=51511 RepID=H2YAI0_CIOSA